MTIRVTKKHICAAIADRFGPAKLSLESCCPIAQAIFEKGIGIDGVMTDSIQTTGGGHIPLPLNAKRFARRFDRANASEALKLRGITFSVPFATPRKAR